MIFKKQALINLLIPFDYSPLELIKDEVLQETTVFTIWRQVIFKYAGKIYRHKFMDALDKDLMSYLDDEVECQEVVAVPTHTTIYMTHAEAFDRDCL